MSNRETRFDFNKAAAVLKIPDNFAVAAMFALGRPGNPETLSDQMREREFPSPRRPVHESICKGSFAF